MTDEADFGTTAEPSLQDLATFLVDEMFDVHRIGRLEQAMANAHQKGATVANAAEVQAASALADKKASLETDGYDKARKALAWALSHLVAHLLGVDAPEELFQPGKLRPQDSAIGQAIGKTLIEGIAGDGGELVPGDDAATRFMGMLAHLTITGWAEGIIVEEFSSLHGLFHPIEEISRLGQELINGLGLNRLARVALRPLAQTLIATPLDWKYKKQFRPNLLSEGEIIKAFLRDDYSGTEAAEELARLGYSDRRQELLIKSASKRLSLEDVFTLVREGTLGNDYALQNLRDEGYDDSTAQYTLAAAEARRYRSVVDDSLSAIVNAYVNRDLDDSQFASFLPGIIADDTERGIHETTARTKRDLNVKHLSHGDVVECIKRLILPQAYYRDWLKREGYPDTEATALELLLLTQINEKIEVDHERARIEREKAAARAAADQAKADRLAEVEQQRALRRLGSVADLTRAVVRGLIPIARLQEVLTQEYDASTVTILSDLALSDRAAYVAQQQAAADARLRAQQRSIDVGAIEAAVLEHVLTIQEFRARLDALKFSPADADLLTATLAAKLRDADAAAKTRADAEQRAKTKSIDLGRAEALVIRGHATLAQYDGLLQTLGYDVAQRAAMVDLLQIKVNDYATAQRERASAAAKRDAHGVTADELRRAVVLGLRPIGDYEGFLVRNGFTADAVALLVATTQADAEQAAVARRRRGQGTAGDAARGLPLATLARAARLGLVTPDVYQAQLVALGYSDDDVALEMDLLTTEIADAVAQRQRRDELAARAPDQGLSLKQLEAAVKLGAASVDDYRGRAAALGYGADDVALLVTVLQDGLTAQADAEARRTTIAGELAVKQLSLSELETAVTKGLRTLEQYRQQLVTWGYGADDAQVLTSLLGTKIAAKSGPAGP